jgi:hypothetical protein
VPIRGARKRPKPEFAGQHRLRIDHTTPREQDNGKALSSHGVQHLLVMWPVRREMIDRTICGKQGSTADDMLETRAA